MDYEKENNEAAKEELRLETSGLDKTDEQKPAECIVPPPSDPFMFNLHSIIYNFGKQVAAECLDTHILDTKLDEYVTDEDVDKYIKKHISCLVKYHPLRNPTKWNNEDDAIHTRVLGALGKAFMGVLPTKPSQEDIEWFKSLPERFNLQPKQEWNEEDEQHKSWILEFLADGESKLPSYAADFRAAYNWLKALCPQPHWKPNEEQIEAVKCAALDVKKYSSRSVQLELENEPYYRALISLYDELKRL